MRNHNILSCGTLAMGRGSAVQLLDEIPASSRTPTYCKDHRISPIPLQHSELDRVFSRSRTTSPRVGSYFPQSHSCDLVVLTRIGPPVSGRFDCLIET